MTYLEKIKRDRFWVKWENNTVYFVAGAVFSVCFLKVMTLLNLVR